MNTVVLIIGTNLGDKLGHLLNARQSLERLVGPIEISSSIYVTDAWGKTDQAAFLNQVIVLKSHLQPKEILAMIHVIEESAGRVRTGKWGPRTLDIDILFYNDAVINQNDLVIPHPGIPSRQFILVPLSEVLAKMVHPVNGQRIEELLQECKDTSGVRKFGDLS